MRTAIFPAFLLITTLLATALHAEEPPFDPALASPEVASLPWERPPQESQPFNFEFEDREEDPTVAAPLTFPASTLSFTWLAPGGAEGFGTADFDFHRSWQWQVGQWPEPVVISPGLGFHLWSGPQVLDLPPRVYDLYLDVSWRMVSRERWGITGGITPGFYGDFERFDGDAFQLTGWLISDWAINERWTVLGGVAYIRQLESNLLVVGGVVWRPSDDWRVEVVVPRPRVARRWLQESDREVWTYVSGAFGGGAWAVDDGNENVLVQYSDFRLTGGIEWLRADGGTTVLELGYVFSRDISVDDFSVLAPDGTALLQISTLF